MVLIVDGMTECMFFRLSEWETFVRRLVTSLAIITMKLQINKRIITLAQDRYTLIEQSLNLIQHTL